MKKMLWAAACCSLPFVTNAQQQLNQLGCATPPPTQVQIEDIYRFVQSPASAARTTGAVDSIPITVHIVGDDNGNGYFSDETIFKVLCQLNQRYQPVGFYFYLNWPLRYIAKSSYYIHNFNGGYAMMNQYNVANTANVYFVQDPSGACGYFSPGADGVAIRKSCSGINSTTLTHEMGHYFGLPHTFYGWENGNTPSNPEKVTRGAGANCSAAGDGFCDTDADYLSERWQCPYNGFKQDANGDVYHPDSSMYMAYSEDACMTRFSTQQITRMQNNLHSDPDRTVLLGNAPAYQALSAPQIAYPTDTMFANKITARWNKVPGADYYKVRVYPGNAVGLDNQVVLTADTALVINFNMINNNEYSIQITPYASTNLCAAFTRTFKYRYSSKLLPQGIGNQEAIRESISLVPNPSNGNGWQLSMKEAPAGNYTIQVLGINGQVLQSQQLNYNSGSFLQHISNENLSNGLYFVRISNDKGFSTSVKAVLQR